MTLRGIAGAGALAVFLFLQACDRGAETETVSAEPEITEEDLLQPDAPEPEPEPVARSGDPLDDDVAYGHELGVIGGHLFAFVEFYRIENFNEALPHLMHANDTLAPAIAPVVAARGATSFAGEMAQLVEAAQNRGSIDSPAQALFAAIRSSAPEFTIAERLYIVSALLNSVGEYYAASVDESGAVTDRQGYQNAYGIMVSAREVLTNAQTNDINISEAIAVAHEQLDLIAPLFPALAADAAEGDPSTIKAAARQIERIANRLG